jgi:chromosome partitioning protein
LGLLALNALAAVDEILIPLQPHFLALQGLGKLLQTVSLVNKRINPELKVKWVLLCMFESRASLPNEVKADIEQFLSSARNTNCAWSQAQMLPVYVRRNITLAEAPSYGQTIFEYDPSCNGAIDYLAVARLIEPRVQTKAAEKKENALATEVTKTAEIEKKSPLEIVEIANPHSQPEPVGRIQSVTDIPLPQTEPADNHKIL